MHYIKNIHHSIKGFLLVTITFFFVFISEYFGFPESKYIGIMTFGYVTFRIWGKNKPDKILNYVWMVVSPFLFTTVGAAFRFS
jgi:hypothetical protein